MKNNDWHKSMYDHYFADTTLNSEDFRKKAADEVNLILEMTKRPEKVLDVPCGTGRHSYLFAKKGFEVTGVDISEACLKIAKENWSHKNVSYEQGDMSRLGKFKGQFDLVLNLFSSIGYFATDKQNEAVLKGMYRSLKKDGVLVLNFINPNWLMTVFKSNDWSEKETEYILNKRLYNAKTKYVEAWMTVIQKKTKEEKTYYFRHRFYTKTEMVSLLKKIGFRRVSVVGDQFGNKFSEKKSTHPYFFAVK